MIERGTQLVEFVVVITVSDEDDEFFKAAVSGREDTDPLAVGYARKPERALAYALENMARRIKVKHPVWTAEEADGQPGDAA